MKGRTTDRICAPIAPKGEDAYTDEQLARQWNSIDWSEAYGQVIRIQTRIARAWKDGNKDLSKRLQHLLTNSFYAKCLAVRRVTSNKGRKTPNIDSVLWNSASSKMDAVLRLQPKGYRSKPLKRVLIPKKNGKKRKLGIPTMKDRTMQALYAMALDPIAETTADHNSFGFRIGCRCQNAAEGIFNALCKEYSAEYILEMDISACFDNISHQWLLDNIPMDKRILEQFLKSGYAFDGGLFPMMAGTPQGGIILPILANMTLDGIQPMLKKRFGREIKVNMYRFADDLIVVTPDREKATIVKDMLTQFMAERGLQLSEEKTFITHVSDGFDFLGWNFRKYPDGKFLVKPSRKLVESIFSDVSEIIKSAKAWTQENLIECLNMKLRGWGMYHRHNVSKAIFQKIDHITSLMLDSDNKL